MAERKYQFRRPTNTDETVEAVYDELSVSPRQGRHAPIDTLKDHVVALHAHVVRVERERADEKNEQSRGVTSALAMLALLAIAALFVSAAKTDEGDWLQVHQFTIRLWGIGFATLFVGVSIERTSFVKILWSFGVTKVIASVSLSALLVFSTGKAAGLINSVFLVDASAFPFTRAIVAGILAFTFAYPLMIVVGVVAALHAANAAAWVRLKWNGQGEYEAPPLMSMIFLAMAIVVSLFFTQWVSRDFSTEMWPAKIYRLAHVLDFNTRHTCANLPGATPVVFLGTEQNKVLIDLDSARTENIESFVESSKSNQVEVPSRFQVVNCETSRLQ